ncbi:putative HTH transcriptional regulator [Clostridium pascui]|uniref:AlbA family DNA-binding domain-containing protein n=1 Tax=Clostridium pascui TaxID=46609 RepID=UPI0019578B44|nr:ATP-binding protein [Clostridium pascui]MBM7870322.1 putative HTH transcriptional regulator [Clostridium pascui]
MDKKRLINLIKKGEGIKLDFKQKLELDMESSRKELAKDICAIANSKGGRGYLIIGVEDKTKKIIGIGDEYKYSEEQIQQIVSSRCEPPIPINLEFVDIENKRIAIINIYDGPQKPYQIRETGAFYIRRGSTTDTMRKEEIISALQENLSLNLELCPIVNSTLDCIDNSLVDKYFMFKGIEANDNNRIQLMEGASIINFDRDMNKHVLTLGGVLVFSRLSYLFAPHSMIKIINKINKNFPQSMVIQGDLLSMLDEGENIIREILPRTYPVKAIYEGLSNAILYRNYALYYKEIEVIIESNNIILNSPGNLLSKHLENNHTFLKRNMWIYEKLITLDDKGRFLNSGRGFARIKAQFKGKARVSFVNSLKQENFKIIYPGTKFYK